MGVRQPQVSALCCHACPTTAFYCFVCALQLCSDGTSGNAVEAHAADACGLSGSSLTDQAGSSSQRFICETEVSQLCPFGWVFYNDDGSEGGNSCLQPSTHVASSWSIAAASCPSGSHLLTVKSTSTSPYLLAFAASLLPSAFFIGCSQNSTAVAPAAGWAWVDNTLPSNLNCASGSPSCGIWNSTDPKCVFCIRFVLSSVQLRCPPTS